MKNLNSSNVCPLRSSVISWPLLPRRPPLRHRCRQPNWAWPAPASTNSTAEYLQRLRPRPGRHLVARSLRRRSPSRLVRRSHRPAHQTPLLQTTLLLQRRRQRTAPPPQLQNRPRQRPPLGHRTSTRPRHPLQTHSQTRQTLAGPRLRRALAIRRQPPRLAARLLPTNKSCWTSSTTPPASTPAPASIPAKPCWPTSTSSPAPSKPTACPWPSTWTTTPSSTPTTPTPSPNSARRSTSTASNSSTPQRPKPKAKSNAATTTGKNACVPLLAADRILELDGANQLARPTRPPRQPA